MLGQIRSREGARAQLFLMVRGALQERVKLAVGRVEPEALKVAIGKPVKLSPGVSRTAITIELPPGSRPAAHLGNDQGTLGLVYIKTGLAEPAELRLLVRYIVEE